MRNFCLGVAVLLGLAALTANLPAAAAQPAATHAAGVLGTWSTPEGSVVRVAPCEKKICIKLLQLPVSAPETKDKLNPSAGLRTRPLCGLTIGTGFHLTDAAHAEGGKLYDPESGKTYSGFISSEGDTLHLRGYVGIRLFGRSETWKRSDASPAPCKQ